MRFWKMQGGGNDFVVIDGVTEPVALSAGRVRRLCDRRLGVGADQLLLVEPARTPEEDFRYRIFNADGGEVEQCGNGARAMGKFLFEKGLASRPEVRLRAAKGVITVRERPDGLLSVDMGAPDFDPASLPSTCGQLPNIDGEWVLSVEGNPVRLRTVSMGNPHAVIRVGSTGDAPVTTLGPKVENHRAFPNRTNVEFVETLSPTHVRFRVWARGAGETPCCGSGACAVVAAGVASGALRKDADIHVETPGGTLTVRWAGPGAGVILSGTVEKVFEGEIELAPQEE